MSKNQDRGIGDAGASEGNPSDRRGSCRYTVAEVPAFLGWWVQVSKGEAPAAAAGEPEPPVHAEPSPRVFDQSIYDAIMARGPAFRGARAARDRLAASNRHGSGHAQNGTTAHTNGVAGKNGQADHSGAAGTSTQAKSAAGNPARQEASKGRGQADAAADGQGAQQGDAAAGEPRMCTSHAWILDLSYTGISLIGETAPAEGTQIWVRLDGVEGLDWVEGQVRGVHPRADGRLLVRIAFRSMCPYDFFKAAVYGSSGQ